MAVQHPRLSGMRGAFQAIGFGKLVFRLGHVGQFARAGRRGEGPKARVALGPGEMGQDGAVRRMRTSLRYPNPSYRSGSKTAAQLGESGGAGLLVCVAILEVALRWKVVVDQGME